VHLRGLGVGNVEEELISKVLAAMTSAICLAICLRPHEAIADIYHKWTTPIVVTLACPTAVDLDILLNIYAENDVDAFNSMFILHNCRNFPVGYLGFVTGEMPGTDFVCFRPKSETHCLWVKAYALREASYP
jgi:hypothetical protein